MIVSIQGTLVSATPLLAVVETHGLGYEVHVPVTTAEKLPRIGAAVKLHTVAIYREDSQALYGFATLEERELFKLLIEHVSGVGPKVALTIMSRLSLPVLRSAIVSGDIGLLSKCPGIGKKTAERLVIEMRDGLDAWIPVLAPAPLPAATGPAAARNRMVQDAESALIALGYKPAEAARAVNAVLDDAVEGSETLIRRALKGMAVAK